MSEHLDRYHTALPPPGSVQTERDALWPGVERLAPATVFVGTLVVIALAIVSALALLTATPAGVSVPTTLLLIGGLVAGSLAIRARVAPTRRALADVPRSSSGPQRAETQERRTRAAREDRTMLLQAGWGESWHPRR